MSKLIFTALAVVVVFATSAFGQQPPPQGQGRDFSKIEVTALDLGNRTYMLRGAGGNITAAIGDDGIIMVDADFPQMHDKIKATLAALSPQPLKYIINTHIHPDHTTGNGLFIKEGVTVVAHANLRNRLAEGTINNNTGVRNTPVPADALPTQPYAGDATTVAVKGRTAQVKHQPTAHTDGDSAIYFADANVLATGDIVSTGNRYPLIDVANGGNIDGMIRAVDNYIALANDQTKVVPGHGALMDRAGLRVYRAMLATARDRVAKLISEGKSVDEAVAAKAIPDVQATAGANDEQTATLVRQIYRSLKGAS